MRWLAGFIVMFTCSLASCGTTDSSGFGGNGTAASGLGVVQCVVSTTCPATADCVVPVCIDGECSVAQAPLGAKCGDNSNVCDDVGNCIECIFDKNCPSNGICTSNICVCDGSPCHAPSCDKQGQCGALNNFGCAACAQSGFCSAQFSTCLNILGCSNIVNCVSNCLATDIQCQVDCETVNPDGVASFHVLTQCVYCEACPNDCAVHAAECSQ
jgi:hypothetical protein